MQDDEKKSGNGILVTALVAAMAGGGSGIGVKYALIDNSDTRIGARMASIERDVAILKGVYDIRASEIKEMRVMISQITDRILVLERFMWSGKRNAKVRLKRGVSVFGIKNEMLVAVMAADHVWGRLGQELVITSGVEALHSKTSRHYLGYAVDLRTRYFTDENKKKARDMLAERLGDDYLVLLESDHIHVEYRPVV